MQRDDVKMSEYIEEYEIKNANPEFKEMLRNSNLIASEYVKCEF